MVKNADARWTSCNNANVRPYFSRRCKLMSPTSLIWQHVRATRNRLQVTRELKKLAAALENAVPWGEDNALVFCRATLKQDACFFRCRFDRLRCHHDAPDVTVHEPR